MFFIYRPQLIFIIIITIIIIIIIIIFFWSSRRDTCPFLALKVLLAAARASVRLPDDAEGQWARTLLLNQPLYRLDRVGGTRRQRTHCVQVAIRSTIPLNAHTSSFKT